MANLLSAFKSGQRSGRRLTQGQKRAIWVGGAAVGAVGVGGLIYYLATKQQKGGGGSSVTVTPGSSPVSVSSGGTLTVNLPPGGTWIQQAGISGGLQGNLSGGIEQDPLVVTGLRGSGSLSLSWYDANGNQQASEITVVAS